MHAQVLRTASKGVFVPLTVGGGIREFTDANGKFWSALDVAAEYFRSGADKVSIGSDAVYAAEQYLASGHRSGTSSIEQISWVSRALPGLHQAHRIAHHPDSMRRKPTHTMACQKDTHAGVVALINLL